MLGISLEKTLDSLVQSSELTFSMKQKILEAFDQSFKEVANEKASQNFVLKGCLYTYTNVTNVWNFWVKDANLSSHSGSIRSPMLKIVAIEQVSDNTDGPVKKQKREVLDD